MHPENSPTLRHRLLIGCAGLVALLMLYVASFGPFCYLWGRARNWQPRGSLVYAPLGWLARRSPIFDNFLVDYSNWFEDLGDRHQREAAKRRSEQP